MPSYRYLPGRTPRHECDCVSFVLASGYVTHSVLRHDPLFLYSLDLVNEGFFWEAHECLEILWRRESGNSIADNIKALIQLCAAALKTVVGPPSAVTRLIDRAENSANENFESDLGVSFCAISGVIKSGLPPL